MTIDAAGSYTVNANGANANTLVYNAPNATINIPAGDRLNVANGAMITGGSIDGPGNFTTSGVSQITGGTPLTLGGGLLWFLGDTVNLNTSVNVGDAAGPTATIRSVGATFNLMSDAAGSASTHRGS